MHLEKQIKYIKREPFVESFLKFVSTIFIAQETQGSIYSRGKTRAGKKFVLAHGNALATKDSRNAPFKSI